MTPLETETGLQRCAVLLQLQAGLQPCPGWAGRHVAAAPEPPGCLGIRTGSTRAGACALAGALPPHTAPAETSEVRCMDLTVMYRSITTRKGCELHGPLSMRPLTERARQTSEEYPPCPQFRIMQRRGPFGHCGPERRTQPQRTFSAIILDLCQCWTIKAQPM